MVHDNNNTILQYHIVHIYLVRGTTTCSNINCRMKINFINTIFFFLLYQHHLFLFTLSTPFKHTVHDDKKFNITISYLLGQRYKNMQR